MDLSFQQNQTFTFSLNVQAWQPLYPLSDSIFHIQVRLGPHIVPVIYAWSSNPSDSWGNGVITYTPEIGMLYITAPYSDMLKLLPGIYEWDLTLQYLDFHRVLTGGAFVIVGGITV